MSIRFFVVGIILLIFFASQFYWLRVAWNLLRRRITRASRRRALASVALLGFAFLFVYNLGFLGRTSPTHMTLRVALLEVPFKLWFFGSLAGFLLVFPLWVLDRIIRMIRRRGRSITEGRTPAASNSAPVSASLASPPRRRF